MIKSDGFHSSDFLFSFLFIYLFVKEAYQWHHKDSLWLIMQPAGLTQSRSSFMGHDAAGCLKCLLLGASCFFLPITAELKSRNSLMREMSLIILAH